MTNSKFNCNGCAQSFRLVDKLPRGTERLRCSSCNLRFSTRGTGKKTGEVVVSFVTNTEAERMKRERQRRVDDVKVPEILAERRG